MSLEYKVLEKGIETLKELKANRMKLTTKREPFEGWTHRFIVKFDIGEKHWVTFALYCNYQSYTRLDHFITSRNAEKIKTFLLANRASKDEVDLEAKFGDEIFNELGI